jgi:U3 small nucleolar RNA-associated protein 25
MAKKSSNSSSKKSKNKGPRGKKARVKAKLEKQWGEQVDDNELRASKLRQGKSRLVEKARDDTPRRAPEQRDTPLTRTEIDSDDDDGGAQISDVSNFLKSISKKAKPSKSVDSDEEILEMAVDDSEDDESVDDEAVIETEFYEENDSETGDPFSAHFTREVLPESEAAISSLLISAQHASTLSTPALEATLNFQLSTELVESIAIKPLENAELSQDQWSKIASGFFHYNRQVLKQNWRNVNRSSFKRNADGLVSVPKGGLFLDSLQSVVYPALASYADVMVTAESVENSDSLHNIVSLHIMNHILTARGRVQRNNKRVKDMEINGMDAGIDEEEVNLRDQGYTRAAVLVLLPTRGICHSFVKSMLSLLGDAAAIESADRFELEYGPVEIQEDEEELDSVRRHRKAVLKGKGREWNELFGDEANSDDDFKIGISFSPKTVKETASGKKSGVGVRLYTDFYKSDIIVASPLALKMATDGSDKDELGDTDFLTSIEICFVGWSDVLMMQNWDHVNSSLSYLNLQPKKNNTTDFSRVREYLLAGQSKYWRQLIICSKFADPSILSTFKRNASSIAGMLKVRRRVSVNEASLVNVLVSTKQVFQRVTSKSFASQGAERLEYFEHFVLPQIQRTKQAHTLIFIPSYFEFISLRNFFMKKEVDFCSVTEYSRTTEVTRGRARFLQGRKPIMLYTGRAHFFSRHAIRGVKHVIFFGLPEHFEFYAQVVNMLHDGGGDSADASPGGGLTSCLSLFTKYEAHALERVCGRQNAERMVKGEKSTFMFLS